MVSKHVVSKKLGAKISVGRNCQHLCLCYILLGRYHTIPLRLPTSVYNFLWCRYLHLTINSFLCICLPTFTYYFYLPTMNSFLCKIQIDTFTFLFYYYSYVDFVLSPNIISIIIIVGSMTLKP